MNEEYRSLFVVGQSFSRNESIGRLDNIIKHIRIHFVKVLISGDSVSTKKWSLEIRAALLTCQGYCNLKGNKRFPLDDLKSIFVPYNFVSIIENILEHPKMEMYIPIEEFSKGSLDDLTSYVYQHLEPEFIEVILKLAFEPNDKFKWLTPEWIKDHHKMPIVPNKYVK